MAHTFGVARLLFARGLALVYLIAFASLWLQWPGLFGERGMEPASAFLERVEAQIGSGAPDAAASAAVRTAAEAAAIAAADAPSAGDGALLGPAQLPTLAWQHAELGLPVSDFCELLALLGMAAAALGAVGLATAPLLALCWLLYLSVFQLGQVLMMVPGCCCCC